MFVLFGLLKFFPDVSPAEGLTIKTTDAVTFDLVPGHIAIVIIASLDHGYAAGWTDRRSGARL